MAPVNAFSTASNDGMPMRANIQITDKTGRMRLRGMNIGEASGSRCGSDGVKILGT